MKTLKLSSRIAALKPSSPACPNDMIGYRP